MKDMAVAFLEERDLTAADLPTFLLVHTALSALWVSSTWYWCYQNPRSSHSFVAKRMSTFTTKAKAPNRVQRLLSNTLPSSLDATRLATSFVEAKVGRLVLKPVTIPTRLWLSWRGTLLWKQQRQQSASKQQPVRINKVGRPASTISTSRNKATTTGRRASRAAGGATMRRSQRDRSE
jgi:hypothetical protein